MEHRTLGRTGMQVSPLCLGAMMFGAWGNPDHDESIRIIHARARRRDQLHRHRRRLLARRVGGDRRQGAGSGRRDDVVLATKVHGTMGDDPNQFGNSRRWIVQEVRGEPARLRHRLDRPLPDPPPRAGHRHRRDARRADRPRPRRQGPRDRLLDVPAVADRRGAVGRRAPRPRALRAASSRPTRCSCAGSRPTCCPTCQRYGMGVIPWSPLGRRLAVGPLAQGRRTPPESSRAERLPDRFDLSDPGEPAQARRRRRARASWPRRPGMTLIELALAFVIRHPAVTSAIIGPRTMEQLESQLAGADVDARPTTCSTASTRSSRPAPTSTRSTPAGRTPRWSPRRGAAEREGGVVLSARSRPASARLTGLCWLAGAAAGADHGPDAARSCVVPASDLALPAAGAAGLDPRVRRGRRGRSPSRPRRSASSSGSRCSPAVFGLLRWNARLERRRAGWALGEPVAEAYRVRDRQRAAPAADRRRRPAELEGPRVAHLRRHDRLRRLDDRGGVLGRRRSGCWPCPPGTGRCPSRRRARALPASTRSARRSWPPTSGSSRSRRVTCCSAG